jgi:hypothetical protein
MRTGALLLLWSSVRYECSTDTFVNASLPMNEVNPTRHLYPQVILRMQEDVEIRKGSRIECSRPTVPRRTHPKVSIYGRRAGRKTRLRTTSPGTTHLVPSAPRERRLHHGIMRRWRSARDARRKEVTETRSQRAALVGARGWSRLVVERRTREVGGRNDKRRKVRAAPMPRASPRP